MKHLYECRSCGVLATDRSRKCPACGAKSGSLGDGPPMKRVDAAEFLEHLQ